MSVLKFLRLDLSYRLCNIALKNHSPYYFKHPRRCFSLQSTYDSIEKTQIAIFKTLSESTPVEYCQSFLHTVHDTTGLPWWGTIICTTIFVRGCVTLPLSLYQQYIFAKLEEVKLEMDEIAKELRKETAIAVRMYKWDEKTARIAFKMSIKKQYNNLIMRENCHPFKSIILLFFQIPLWISLSVSLRNLVYMLPSQDVLAQITFLQLTVGGFGWIHNLVEVDTFFILPVLFGVLNLAIIELQALSKVKPPSKFQKNITNVFRGVSVLMIPIAASVPSCVVLYWTASSAVGLVQNLIILSPKVRRFCKIPLTANEIQNPYQYVWLKAQDRMRSLPFMTK